MLHIKLDLKNWQKKPSNDNSTLSFDIENYLYWFGGCRKIEILLFQLDTNTYRPNKEIMSKLIPGNNYSFQVRNYSCTPSIRKSLDKPVQFVKNDEGKLVFTNGKQTFTLWTNQRYKGYYICYVTKEKNNNYRLTRNGLNSNSVFLRVSVCPIQVNFLTSFSCITTLETFLFLIDFYNKTNIKKNLRERSQVISKIFQDNYVLRYISEFL